MIIRDTQSYTVSTLFVMLIEETQNMRKDPQEQTDKEKLQHKHSSDLKPLCEEPDTAGDTQ